MVSSAFNKLVAHRMAMQAIPPGGGVGACIAFLLDKDRVRDSAKEATAWVNAAIDAVISAPDNPYGTDREKIAAELVRRIDEQAEAVRVLAAEVDAAWEWNDAFPWNRPDTWDHATAEAVRNNPTAAAAVKEAGQ